MLKPQDVVIILKILAKGSESWSQGGLAVELGMSASEVNAGIKRAMASKLLRKHGKRVVPVKSAIEEFLLHGLKYVFPVETGEPTRGLPTAHAAPVFKGKFVESKNDLPPVWPDAEGEVKGYKIKPLYKSVPVAVKLDDVLYDYLAIVDVLRSGRAREVNEAIKIMRKIMEER